MNPTISIVMPVYNVAPYLRECLDSVRAQTFTDWECICVDDGSTDSSLTLLAEDAAKDPRFHVVRREHSNAGACRNAGLDLARGEFLSFLDSDDIFHPKMLETLIAAIESDEADIASCGWFSFDDERGTPAWPAPRKKEKRTVWKRPADETDIFSRWVGWTWDKLFRRSFVLDKGIRFQEIPSSNDALFTYAALSLVGAMTETGRTLVAHRKWGGSIEATRNAHADCIAKAILAYRDEMAKRGAFSGHPRLEGNFKKWALHILLWHLDTINSLTGYEKLHSSIPELAKSIGLDRLDNSAFAPNDDSPDRLSIILSGAAPIESIRFHERRLLMRVEQMDRFKRLALSMDYRLGNAILRIPRWLKRIVKD